MAGRPHRAEGVARPARHHCVDGVQYAARRLRRDVPGIRRDVGIAGAQRRAPGEHVVLRRSQVLRGVAQEQFLFGGRAPVHPRQPFEQARLPQTPHHGIEPLGPFRMFAPRQVFAENGVGQQRR